MPPLLLAPFGQVPRSTPLDFYSSSDPILATTRVIQKSEGMQHLVLRSSRNMPLRGKVVEKAHNVRDIERPAEWRGGLPSGSI